MTRSIEDSSRRRFQDLTRRRLLGLGAIGPLGISLPRLLQAEGASGQTVSSKSPMTEEAGRFVPRAKSCILFFMEGGPSHIDLWDLKPDAPSEIRSIYQPIATTLPGFDVCEHLPRLARVAHHLCVVRSVNHSFVDHNASSHFMLTGQIPIRSGQLVRGPSRENFPPYGSVLTKLRPSEQPVPDYVHLPKEMFNCGSFIPGVRAGFLGDQYDPFIAGDPSVANYRVPDLHPVLSDEHYDRRRSLLSQIDRASSPGPADRSQVRLETFYDKAYRLIASPQARRAFDLNQEPDSVRQRYGLGKGTPGYRGGGLPHLGQSMLLARRLVEAGVRLVSVWAGGQAFDGHTNLYASLTNSLCPPTDQAFSALIEDLAERGLLEETLVVALAEFGRTPKLGQVTSSAGATPEGRDHWPNCYTVFFAGGGVRPGMVFGASDKLGAYPDKNPVSPQDIAATIYTLLGVDTHTGLIDQLQRPHRLAEGQPIRELFEAPG